MAVNLSQSALDILIWIFITSGVIQLSPVKINPWSWIGHKIGKTINGEVISKMQGLESKMEKIQNDFSEERAVTARVRILRFNDELLQNVKHSKESFDQCLSDIDMYEHYCEEHRDFKNNKTVLAADNIKEIYNKCLRTKNFL